MTTIDAIGQLNTVSTGRTSADDKTLGKDDFLNLLVTQLRHQDPMNPMESAEFSAQLAQFSSLEQLSNISDQMDTAIAQQAAVVNNQAVGFIGRKARLEGNVLQVEDGAPRELVYDLENTAWEATVYIKDAAGNIVRTIELDEEELESGEHSLTCNAKNDSDAVVPDGFYSFEVVATGKDQMKIGTTHYIRPEITGVAFQNGSATLVSNDLHIPLDEVIEIEAAETTDETDETDEEAAEDDAAALFEKLMELIGG